MDLEPIDAARLCEVVTSRTDLTSSAPRCERQALSMRSMSVPVLALADNTTGITARRTARRRATIGLSVNATIGIPGRSVTAAPPSGRSA